MREIDRRDFIKLAGLGGVVFASGLGSGALGGGAPGKGRSSDKDDFYFVQLSDTHWGFDGPAINPDSKGTLKKAQTRWLEQDLKLLANDAPIVVLTHRPLFDLYPQWDWSTRDGSAVIDVLMPYKNVTVFYGHIHQEHHYVTGHIAHHAAKSLMFPLPQPGSAPKRAPVPWDQTAPYRGLGFRDIEARTREKRFQITELSVTKG